MLFIPGISKIFVIEAERLPANVVYLYEAAARPLVMLELRELQIGPQATAEFNAEQAEAGDARKTKLSFSSGELPISQHADSAFVIVSAEGEPYLIGAKEPPFPKVTATQDLSHPAEGKAGFRYQVEWEGPLIPVTLYEPSFYLP